MKTIWDNITLKEFPRLDSNLSTDVLVIGGGICGILCAHMLAQTGKKVILVEKDRLVYLNNGPIKQPQSLHLCKTSIIVTLKNISV